MAWTRWCASEEKIITLTTASRVFLMMATLGSPLLIPGYLPIEAQRQQDSRALRMQEVKELPAKSKRFALVIGVDEYRDKQINRLYGASKDAQTLRDALVRYAGFPEDHVTLLATGEPEEREPSRANILQRLLNLNGLVPQDGLLLVSFAGHGMQRGEKGFLLPVDAKIGSLSQLENTAISVADLSGTENRDYRLRRLNRGVSSLTDRSDHPTRRASNA